MMSMSNLHLLSALEIMNKLCDNDFFRKAMAADVLIKVYTLFMEAGVGQGDKARDLSLTSDNQLNS